MIVASAVFWMQYVDLKDRNKHEPRKLLLLAFLLGLSPRSSPFCFSPRVMLSVCRGRKAGENYGRLVIVSWLIGPWRKRKVLLAYLIVFRCRNLMNRLMDSCMRSHINRVREPGKCLQSAAPAVMGAIGAHGGASPHAHALRCGLGFGIAWAQCASRRPRAGRQCSRQCSAGDVFARPL